jgi:hypothetical protein
MVRRNTLHQDRYARSILRRRIDLHLTPDPEDDRRDDAPAEDTDEASEQQTTSCLQDSPERAGCQGEER